MYIIKGHASTLGEWVDMSCETGNGQIYLGFSNPALARCDSPTLIIGNTGPR